MPSTEILAKMLKPATNSTKTPNRLVAKGSLIAGDFTTPGILPIM